MNSLQESYANLNQVIQADTVLCLAQAVAWLDPLWRNYDEDFDVDHDPEGMLKEALVICRRAFPGIYVEAISRLREGQAVYKIDHFICEKISAEGIPIDSIEQMPWGIPLYVYGIDLNDEETYENHPELEDILDLLDVELSRERYGIDIATSSHVRSQYLIDSLEREEHPIYKDVADALSWVFSTNANSIVAWNYEMLYEVEMLQWNDQGIEFAKYMIQEAEDIMCKVRIGLEILSNDQQIRQEIKKNSRKLAKHLERKKDNDRGSTIRLKWTCLSMMLLSETPHLSLDFYSYGCILRKCENGLMSEYPVDLQQVMTSLTSEISFDTGILNHEILMIRQTGLKKTVVGYRKRQKTGIWLEGTEDALRIPLPDLVLIRVTRDNQSPEYKVYAVKGRPTSLSAKLFNCPLPNVFNTGSICWGTVKRADKLSDSSLDVDFSMLLGSPFGNHATSKKSKAHPSDIRKHLLALDQRSARVYPRKDLISAETTLANTLGDK